MLFTAGRIAGKPAGSCSFRDYPEPIGSIMRKPILLNKAGLLACNIPVILPMPLLATQWTYQTGTLFITYSCATARDLHTVPVLILHF